MGILDQFRLDGKVAMVTGVSRGLGRGMALGLAEAGADIVGVGPSDMSGLRAEVEILGRRCATLEADLTSPGTVGEIFEKALKEMGSIDILVNNSGIIRRSPIVELSEKDWDDVINVNLKSLFLLSQAAARYYISRGCGGKIVNIASMLSFQGGIGVSSYTAAKSGVMGLTRIMACELASHGINVNAIAPGYMATDNTAPLRKNPVRNDEILKRIPAGRWGTPEDLQGAVVFLSSEASSYMNGYTVAVDGGWLAR